MIKSKVFLTLNGKDIPCDLQVATPTAHTPTYDWNKSLQRIRNTTIHCDLYPENMYQPTGPIVEGTIETKE